MCTLSALKCPLCAKTNFPNIDSLRISLIKAANGPLSCPICQELLLGLDKLTIHLFSHTNVMLTDTTSTETATASFGQIDSKRAIICETVKKTNPSSEVKLEPKDLVSPPALIKRMSKENKTKKTRKFINDQLKIVEKLNLDCSYNAVSPESEIRVNNNIAYNNLSICDICEFTFRDDELLDMHFRLVHQNRSSSHRNFETNGTSSTEPDFKCHLCSKTFKMKGSLRVHLKVVHQMYLPNMSNNNKLSICDRIRQKETQICANGNKKPQYLTPSMDKATDNSNAPILRPSPTEPLQQHQTPTTTQVTNGFPFGTLTLLPPSTVPSNEFLHLVDGAPLNSNVLFVINTNAGALSHQDAETDGGSESKNSVLNGNIDVLDLQQTTITENTKVWKCNECAKTFTTKYFLKKHKRLHTAGFVLIDTNTVQKSGTSDNDNFYIFNENNQWLPGIGGQFKEYEPLPVLNGND